MGCLAAAYIVEMRRSEEEEEEEFCCGNFPFVCRSKQDFTNESRSECQFVVAAPRIITQYPSYDAGSL